VEEPFQHSHILENMKIRFYDTFVSMDGKQSMSGCFQFNIHQILKIVQIDDNEVEIHLIKGIRFRLKVVTDNLKLWTRKAMVKSFGMGCLYE